MPHSYPSDSAAPSGTTARHPRLPWSLFLLILLAFGLYTWRLDAKSIWWDESLSLYRAQQDIPYILSNRIEFPGHISTDLHPPLYFIVLHIATRLFGESDTILRLPSALLTVLIVPLLYALGARMRGRRAGWCAALFGALSPFYLWYAQEARMYAMVTLLGLASCYALYRGLTTRRWRWDLAAGVLLVAAVATQYLAALVIIPQALLTFFLWPRQDVQATQNSRPKALSGRKALFWVGLLVLGILLAWLGVQAARLAISPKEGRWYVAPQIMLYDALNSFSLGLSVEPGQVWPLVALFSAIFALGCLSMWRDPVSMEARDVPVPPWQRQGAGLALLVGYALLPIAAMWLFSFFAPVYMSSRYVIVFSPGFYLGVGVGLAKLWEERWAATGLLSVALILGIGHSTYRYFAEDAYRTKEDHRSAARYIALNEREGDLIIVNAPENMVAFMHYYEGRMPVVGMPSAALAGEPDPQRVADEMATLAASCDRIWLAHCRTMFSDPYDLVKSWLNTRAFMLEEVNFPSYGSDVSVSAYLSRYPVEPGAQTQAPIGVFDTRLALATFTIRGLEPSGSLPAGQSVSVALRWQPLEALGRYKTSLRLVDGRGVVWAQRDREPFMYLPTTQWAMGDTVHHEADLPIPVGTPPGSYQLHLVVYEEESLKPLPFQRAGHDEDRSSLMLGDIVVGAARQPASWRRALPTEFKRPALETAFGRSLRLLAYDLAPPSASPGGTLRVEVYWQCLRAIAEDYQVVVNWRDAQGHVWHSTTQPLLGIDSPPGLWREGDVLRGLLALPVPANAPLGRHTLHLLVKPADRAQFLWVRQGPLLWSGRNVKIGTISIE